MTTANTTIASAIAALTSLDTAVGAVRSLGLIVEVSVGGVFAAPVAQDVVAVAPQTAFASSAPVTETTSVAATTEETLEVSTTAATDKRTARLAEVVGSTISARQQRGNSTGMKIDVNGRNAFTVGGEGNLNNAFGFINVYPKSLGKDIHKTASKAAQYASDSVVAQLPVFSA